MKLGGYGVMIVVGALVTIGFLGANAARDLTETELRNTYGREGCYDCDGVMVMDGECSDPFAGCVSNATQCTDWRVGTGNTREVCVTCFEETALCEEQEEQIKCEEGYNVTPGPPQNSMTCSTASWCCISGSGTCIECYQGDPWPSIDLYLPTYECPVEES